MSRAPRRSRDARRRRISSSAEDEPPTLNLRSLRSHDVVPADGNEEEGPTRDKAEMWAEFAADHYEILEQLPLELHRNSRLIRELDQESLSQERKLEAGIREYIAHRFALAQPKPKDGEVERRESPLEVKPSITPAPETAEAAAKTAEVALQPASETLSEPKAASKSRSQPPVSKSRSPQPPAKSKSRSPTARPVSILSPDSSKLSATPAPKSAREASTSNRDATPERDGDRDLDADGSPDPDAVGSPDPDADAAGSPDADADADADAVGSPDPSVSPVKPVPNIGLGSRSAEPVSMSRQSSSSEVGAVDDAVAIDEDDETQQTPARNAVSAPPVTQPAPAVTTPAPAPLPAPAPPHAAASVPPTERPPGPACAVPNASSLALGDIQRLIRELVRNREEKVAIAIGAYNAVDRHIRALDSMLDKPNSLGLLTTEATPVVEEPAAGQARKRKKKGAPPVIPPNIEVDPNEPRYCYCNNVSFGEMVGCDNEDCPYEWFHLACLGMTAAPVGNWLCDACKPGGSGVKEERRGPKKKRR